jgi:hypothetical protein
VLASIICICSAFAPLERGFNPKKFHIAVCTNFGAGHYYYYYFSGAGRLAVEQVASA